MNTKIKNIETEKIQQPLEYIQIPEDGVVVSTNKAINKKSSMHLQQEEERVFEGAGIYESVYFAHIATQDPEASPDHPYTHYALVSGKNWRNREVIATVTESGRKIVLKPGINVIGDDAFSVFIGESNNELMILNGRYNNDTRIVADARQPSLDDLDELLSLSNDLDRVAVDA